MSVFVRPGAVCAADRRESRFDSAFHRNNSLVLFSPLPVGLGGSGLSRRAVPASTARWGQMGARQDSGMRIAPDLLSGAVAAGAPGEAGNAQQTAKELSGLVWVGRFPTSKSTDTLTRQFKANVDAFIAALRAAGATVRISATHRPAERAYLMHYAWKIANGQIKPADVPEKEGVHIEWDHGSDQASINAAKAMVSAYGMKYPASLTSRHITRQAIDMTITGYSGRTVAKNNGEQTTLRTAADLHALGQSYGVIKLVKDPPHWSTDGR